MSAHVSFLKATGVTATFAAFLLFAGVAGATTVPITGYDVMQTPASGFGCWHHVYTGTITPTSRTLSTSACGPVDIVNEAGGGGTLNDGVDATTNQATQLFDTLTDDAGAPIKPTITLHLSEKVKVSKILLQGGNWDYNIFGGTVTGVTVTIGGTAVALPTQPTGTQLYFGKADDLLDLSGTSLAGVNTDTVQLSDLLNSWQGTYLGQLSLAEIVVYATPTIADEIAWVQTSSLPNGTKQSLLAKLTNAQAALGAGHAKEAVNILNAALHYISAQAGKSIPQATATKLNDDITAIEAAIKS